MQGKVIKAFIGRKTEKVNPDNALIPEGTILKNLTPERYADLVSFGYIEAPANKAKKFKK